MDKGRDSDRSDKAGSVRSSVPIVLLAAGRGARLGQCKPLARVGNNSLLERSIGQLRPLTTRLVVVLGFQYQRVRLRTRIQPHHWVVNPDWAQGQSTSLQAGLNALQGSSKGALICLVDQPNIPTEHLQELIRRAEREPGRGVATGAGGRAMAPAYLPRTLWPDIHQLGGDQGARRILKQFSQIVDCEEAMDDIDLPEDLIRFRESAGSPYTPISESASNPYQPEGEEA